MDDADTHADVDGHNSDSVLLLFSRFVFGSCCVRPHGRACVQDRPRAWKLAIFEVSALFGPRPKVQTQPTMEARS